MSVRDLTILGCSSQQPTRFRNHGAYLLRWNNEGLLFDPGEGTQRQFIFAEIAPPTVTRIFVSHFHGDHCLGLGSMFMRLNLDKIQHPIHVYYPASGKKFFDRLRYCCIYRENIKIIEHPISEEGLVHEDNTFRIEAYFLEHGAENLGYRVSEMDTIKFDRDALKKHKIWGPSVRELEREGKLFVDGKEIFLKDVSSVRKGDTFSYVVDTRPCLGAEKVAKDAKMLVCESTYLHQEKKLAQEYMHMTALQAAELALKSNVKTLVLTHFSARYRDPKVMGVEAKEIFPNTYVAEDLKKIPFPK